MKTLIIFLIGLLVGGYLMRTYEDRYRPAGGAPLGERARENLGHVGETAGGVRGDIAEKLRQWHLTSDDIREDIAKTGQVVRAKARVVGERIDDVRIAALLKAKYVLDRDLAARDIAVRVSDGEVTLSGTVASIDLIGRAVALALDTDGVTNVVAHLAVQPKGA